MTNARGFVLAAVVRHRRDARHEGGAQARLLGRPHRRLRAGVTDAVASSARDVQNAAQIRLCQDGGRSHVDLAKAVLTAAAGTSLLLATAGRVDVPRGD